MRKLLFGLFVCLPLAAFSQTEDVIGERENADSVGAAPLAQPPHDEDNVARTKKKSSKSKKTVIDEMSVKMDVANFCLQYAASNLNAARYKMYQTDNMNYLLKLDSFTGRVWQVQWSHDVEEEGIDTVNGEPLSNASYVRFELYPTKNIYQFILLDRETGNQWHLQWGTEPEKRWTRKIE